MAFDTIDQRASALRRYLTPLPRADGDIGAGDRAQALWQWRGAFDGAVVVVPFGRLTGTVTVIGDLTGSVTD